jgi:hypothetical protein
MRVTPPRACSQDTPVGLSSFLGGKNRLWPLVALKVPEDGLEGTGEMHGGTQRPLLPMCSSTSAHWRL